jgi:lysozyme
MKTSKNGLEFIARWEGTILNPYICAAGKWTIGVGHVIRATDSFSTISNVNVKELLASKDKNHPVASLKISKEEAFVILAKDIEITEKALSKDVTVPLTQNQFDALVSFGFNCGTGVYRTSGACKSLNAGDYQAFTVKLLEWCKIKVGGVARVNQGLLNRRKSEVELFNSPSLAPEENPPPTLISWTVNLLIEVQTRLKKLGLYPGFIDGLYGPATKRGLEDFAKKFSAICGDDLRLGVPPAFLKKLEEKSN